MYLIISRKKEAWIFDKKDSFKQIDVRTQYSYFMARYSWKYQVYLRLSSYWHETDLRIAYPHFSKKYKKLLSSQSNKFSSHFFCWYVFFLLYFNFNVARSNRTETNIWLLARTCIEQEFLTLGMCISGHIPCIQIIWTK